LSKVSNIKSRNLYPGEIAHTCDLSYSKLNIDLTYYPVIPHLGIYLKECDSGYSKGTCAPMFIAALLTIAKLWKQPSCPTTNESIKKIGYLYTMKFYSATKTNGILSFTSK
jgi:hypothetical protein